jgi:hypothetical protein
MSDIELPPVIALKAAVHKKGTPYPEMVFDQSVEKYGRMYTEFACYSNEDIKTKLDEHYQRNPKATDCTYFWYELFKEPIKTEQL